MARPSQAVLGTPERTGWQWWGWLGPVPHSGGVGVDAGQVVLGSFTQFSTGLGADGLGSSPWAGVIDYASASAIGVFASAGAAGFVAWFAIGDATDADPRKLVLPAVSQAKVAARNVRAMLAGRAPETDYRPARGEMLIVPVGPDDGGSVLPGLEIGGRVTSRLKSADLLVARYRKVLNLPRRGAITPASVTVGAR